MIINMVNRDSSVLTTCLGHICSSPAVQLPQFWHESTMQPTPIFWPTVTFVTLAPTATQIPQIAKLMVIFQYKIIIFQGQFSILSAFSIEN